MVRRILLTTKEFAKAVGWAPVTVRTWIAQGRIEYVRLGRSVRIPVSELNRLIAAGKVPARGHGDERV